MRRSSAGIIAIPLTVGLAVLARRDSGAGALGGLIVAVLMVSGLFVGFAGGRLAPGRRLTHAAIAAVMLFVGIQITYSVVRGSAPNPIGFVYTALLFASLGTLGGVLANWWLTKAPRTSHNPRGGESP